MKNWIEQNIPKQTGKIALVTGANSGIGFQTALELARTGAHIILGCRNSVKAEEAKRRITYELPNAKIHIETIDLGDLSSIKNFCKSFVAEGHTLDILVCNAGIMIPQKRVTTKDGFELQWGTNYLGHFALTGGLMPALLKADEARIVIVSSIAYRSGRIMFDDINAEKSYDPMKYYQQSKLADTLFGIELDRLLQEYNARARCILAHPGISRTELLPNSHKIKSNFTTWISKTLTRLGMPAKQGALSSIYAATSPNAIGGHLYGPDRMKGLRGFPKKEEFDKTVHIGSEKIDRLWRISEMQTGVTFKFK